MKETINFLRDLAHLVLGFTFLYKIGNATAINDFWLWQKILGSIVIGSVFGGVMGAIFEKAYQELADIVPSMKDIILFAIGGVLGCLTSCFFTDVHFIIFWMFNGCIALIVVDLARAIYKKHKELK